MQIRSSAWLRVPDMVHTTSNSETRIRCRCLGCMCLRENALRTNLGETTTRVVDRLRAVMFRSRRRGIVRAFYCTVKLCKRGCLRNQDMGELGKAPNRRWEWRWRWNEVWEYDVIAHFLSIIVTLLCRHLTTDPRALYSSAILNECKMAD